MKKVFLSIALTFLIANVSFAQKITLGVKGGLNLVGVSTNFPIINNGKKGLTSFHVGGIVDFSISNHFSLQPQILYNGKGIKFQHVAHSHTISSSSVDMPIYAVYKTAKGFFVGAGPNFNINISGKNVSSDAGEATTYYKSNGSENNFNRFGFGANAIMGYQHKSGVLVSANYLKEFTKSFNITGYNWTNNVVAISVGYMFKNR